jgi:hypothetical protein
MVRIQKGSILETEIVGQIDAQDHAVSDRSFFAARLVLGADVRCPAGLRMVLIRDRLNLCT